MSNTTETPNRIIGPNVWERTAWLWSGIYFLSVIFSVALAWNERDLATARPQILIIVILMLALHGGMLYFGCRDAQWREKLPSTVGYVAITLLLWFLLIRISPTFYFVLFGLFGQMFWFLPLRWATGATVVVIGMMVYQQTIGNGRPFSWLILLIYGVMGAGGVLLGAWIDAIINQSAERQSLIEQLEATQSELAESERRAGVLAERQRLAQEIHDTLAQGFISVIMHLETAVPRLPDDPILHKHLTQAEDAARDGLTQARRVVQALRPAALEIGSLPDALHNVVAKWQQQSGIPATFTVTGAPLPLAADAEVTLLRATQEALANVHKHAQATAVSVTLSYVGDAVLLDVQDDGVGLANGRLATDPTHSGGYGLTAMRERVTQHNGAVELESESGEGTTLVVSIPVSRAL